MKNTFKVESKLGGQYVPETLMAAVLEVEKAFNRYKENHDFLEELKKYHQNYTGRPSLLYYAKNMSEDLGGAKVYLKREDLNHTGAHKINNVLGQVLLAKKMGKKKVIAETGAGQHGVATATVCALLHLECEVFMGEEDIKRQELNVYRMQLLGAKVTPVTSGGRTLKDAINAALAKWCACCIDTFYCIGSVMGPKPYPEMVRYFQSIIGEETKAQILEIEGKLPHALIACVGGGSNAIGFFAPFIKDSRIELIGVEAGGKGVETPFHAATLEKGRIGIFHGMKSYFLQTEEGWIAPAYSISPGLDYPGVGPDHAELKVSGRAKYVSITDKEAVDAFKYLARTEGIIPAIESAHAIAYGLKYVKTLAKNQSVLINLSGRGDKDVAQIASYKEGDYE